MSCSRSSFQYTGRPALDQGRGAFLFPGQPQATASGICVSHVGFLQSTLDTRALTKTTT